MVNDVLHGERIVDGTAVAMRLDRASARSWRRGSLEFPKCHRSNFNKTRGEFAANFPKIRIARRTAFSNVARMVALGE